MKTKTRKTTRILCASSIAAMTLLGSVAPALTTVAAEDGSPTAATTPINLTANENKITFDKKILLDKNENVPNATINYKLEGRDASGDEKDPTSEKGALANAGYHNVENGTATLSDLPKDLSTKFEASDSVKVDDKGQRYITKTCTIDARKLVENTKKPTVYTYTLTEAAQDAASNFVTTDKGTTRKLNIYVGYDESNKLAVLHSTLALEDGTKATGFENKYETSDNDDKTNAFKVTKQVTGNQGDKTKYFNFTVTITGQHSKVTTEGGLETQATTPEANDSTVTVTTQLKDGDSLTLKGLTKGATYTVDEKEKNEDGYTTTGLDKRETDEKTKTEVTVVKNERIGTIPTGIYLNHKLPFNILGVALAGGAVALIAKKRHEDALEDEDDE